jgi:hypothetical protein
LGPRNKRTIGAYAGTGGVDGASDPAALSTRRRGGRRPRASMRRSSHSAQISQFWRPLAVIYWPGRRRSCRARRAGTLLLGRIRALAVGDDSWVRVVSWNVNFPGSERAAREGALLRELCPTLVLLQEVNPASAGILRQAAGAGWMVCADELPDAAPGLVPARCRVTAVAGYGLPDPHPRALLEGLQPWRTLAVATTIGGVEVFAASYHAPPGVSYGIAKPRQAVAFASWLEGHRGPVLFGADANTPLVDAVGFAAMRTHWHTGDRRLNGEPGDDLLFGPGKKHALDDALRRWLAEHPDEMADLR